MTTADWFASLEFSDKLEQDIGIFCDWLKDQDNEYFRVAQMFKSKIIKIERLAEDDSWYRPNYQYYITFSSRFYLLSFIPVYRDSTYTGPNYISSNLDGAYGAANIYVKSIEDGFDILIEAINLFRLVNC